MNNLITADTITDDQIRALRTEASGHGDDAQITICDRALYGTAESPSTILSLIADGHLSDAQVEARQLCADAINNARAQVDR